MAHAATAAGGRRGGRRRRGRRRGRPDRSPGTVRTHITRIFGKLHPRDRAQSKLLLSNAGDVVSQVHAVAGRPRLPSLALAYVDLALYLVAALGLGAWRSTRDV